MSERLFMILLTFNLLCLQCCLVVPKSNRIGFLKNKHKVDIRALLVEVKVSINSVN